MRQNALQKNRLQHGLAGLIVGLIAGAWLLLAVAPQNYEAAAITSVIAGVAGFVIAYLWAVGLIWEVR